MNFIYNIYNKNNKMTINNMNENNIHCFDIIEDLYKKITKIHKLKIISICNLVFNSEGLNKKLKHDYSVTLYSNKNLYLYDIKISYHRDAFDYKKTISFKIQHKEGSKNPYLYFSYKQTQKNIHFNTEIDDNFSTYKKVMYHFNQNFDCFLNDFYLSLL